MIIYGSKATHLVTERITGQCPSCGANDTIQLTAFQKYAHVFWIPMFPIGKEFVSQCTHCSQVLRQDQIANHFRLSLTQMKAQAKTPVWSFVGLGLICVFVVSSIMTSQQDKKQNRAFIQSPATGDIYHYKTKDNQYTLLKVNDVIGDTVFVLQNEYETNKLAGLNSLRSKEYSTEIYALLKEDLTSMFDRGEIIDVDRSNQLE